MLLSAWVDPGLPGLHPGVADLAKAYNLARNAQKPNLKFHQTEDTGIC